MFCHRLGRDQKIDIDVVMNWPIDKVYRWMAFYLAENKEFQKKVADEKLTPEDRHKQLIAPLKGFIK